jgi:hypothetical protein
MPVNTNDLRDMASEFRETSFTAMVIEAANQLDSTRTERNILRAELDAAREELREVKAERSALRALCLEAAELYGYGGTFPIRGVMAMRLTGAALGALPTRAQGESS